jgi:TetR/AcrR family transcriptional regulator
MVGQYRQDQDSNTRESLLGSATEAFAEKGFSGARVDEIAQRAHANKAMIYYHFGSKEGLYKAVLLRHIGGIHQEIRAAIEAEKDPLERLQLLYRGLGNAFQARPALPFIMIHEILAGGSQMDAEVAGAFKGVVDLVRAAVEQGVTQGRMRPVNPIFVHFMMIAPLIVFNVSHPYRQRFLPVAAPSAEPITADAFAAQLEDALARLVAPAPGASVKRRTR